MADRTDEPSALSSEALARDEWRGEETRLRPEDAPGHTLPESESGDGGSGGGGSSGGGAKGPRPIAGTMLPPD